MNQTKSSQSTKCCDPDCGCTTPAFTEPMEALRFLSGRFKYAGVDEGVALAYAQDIDAILEKTKEDCDVGLVVEGSGVNPLSKSLMSRLREMDRDCFNLRGDRQVSLKLELLDDLREELLSTQEKKVASPAKHNTDAAQTEGWSIQVKRDRDGELGVWAVNDGTSIWLAKADGGGK